MGAQLQISLGQCSDPGIKSDNQDFYGCVEPTEPQLTYKGIAVAIADGMSGSDAGKTASHACIIGFLSDYFSTPDSWTVKYAAQKILSATNSWLHSTGQAKYQSSRGMVSTLSILILKSNTAHLFHIGDSRVYRLRTGDLEQLTRDHRVWDSDEKSYLNRAMGIESHLEVDYRALPLQMGDTFLLTTDGVHDFLTEKALKTLLNQNLQDLQKASEAMVALALENNSNDNLTCQLLRVESLPVQETHELWRQHANRPFPPPLEPGMILDGYRVEKELHASKRTQIYKAFDTKTETTVVLKTPSVNYEDDPVYIEQFLHEEWVGKRVNHKNVLKVLETDRQKKSIYYVTEYIDGQTLRQWMNDNAKPDPKRVILIIEQITKGLQAFHRMEMLHQDIKPENIMFDQSGNAKIIDFGSVKISGIAELKPRKDHESILGTLNYSAPEYLQGQRGDTRSDLFSLAVIAYEMLNGALPFGRDMPERADRFKLSRLEYVPSIQHNPMVPLWMDGAIKKALALNPNQRYDDLFEFMYDLTHPNSRFLSETSVPLIQRNPLRFWQGTSAILLLVNLVLVYFVTR